MTRACAVAIAAALALAGAPAAAQPAIHDVPEGGEVTPSQPAEPPRPPAAPDRRPIYVAAGVLVLAAIFLWNRRRRAELERQAEDDARRRRAQARAARGVTIDPAAAPDAPDAAADDDPDAAALRAAARSATATKDEEPT